MDETMHTDTPTVTTLENEPFAEDYPVYLTPEESEHLFDEATQYYLGISGDEFRRRWETGEYGEEEADRGPVGMLLMTMPPRK